MRRIAVVLIILLIIAGVIFYFGWIQFRLPANTYGVIFSRTSGWEREVVEAGTFTWRWQRLLPTNLTLYVFDVPTRRLDVTVAGDLPSADTYASTLDADTSFSFEVEIDLLFEINPSRLPELARVRDLRPDTLDEFYGQVESAVQEVAAGVLVQLIGSDSESAGVTGLAENLKRHLESRFPEVVFHSVTPVRVAVPDRELYERSRTLYFSVIDARAQALRDAARAVAQVQAETERDLGLLERYGEILDRYPVLLDYFRLGQGVENDP